MNPPGTKLLSLLSIFGGVLCVLLGGALLWAGLIVGALGLSNAYPQLLSYHLDSEGLENVLLAFGTLTVVNGFSYFGLALSLRSQNSRDSKLGIYIALSSIIINVLSTVLFGLENGLNIVVAGIVLASLSRTRVKTFFRRIQMRSVLIIVLVITTVVVSGLINGGLGSVRSPALFNVGDRWTFHYSTGENLSDTTLRAESCGLGVSYVVEHQSKAETDVLWSNPDLSLKREVYATSAGVTTYSYDPPLAGPFPLAYGRQWWSNSTVTASFVPAYGIVPAGDNGPRTFYLSTFYKVVGGENLTVAAGRFFSYKVEAHSPNGQLLRIDWYNLQVRSLVFSRVFNSDGSIQYTSELTSFSSGEGIIASGTFSILALCFLA